MSLTWDQMLKQSGPEGHQKNLMIIFNHKADD